MICTECGAQIPGGMKFCSTCGKAVSVSSAVTVQEIQQRQKEEAPSPFPSGNSEEGLEQVKGWNWGAFFITLIWCACHGLWLYAVLMLLPGVNFVVKIYVGIKGNELAWKKRPFEDVKQFKDTQRIWALAGLILFLIGIVFSFIMMIVAAVAIPNFVRAREIALFSNCQQTLKGVQATVEKIAISNPGTEGPYANVTGESVCGEMLQKPGCATAELEARVQQACTAVGGVPWTFVAGVDVSHPSVYRIQGAAMNRNRCAICITPAVAVPPSYTPGCSAESTCP